MERESKWDGGRETAKGRGGEREQRGGGESGGEGRHKRGGCGEREQRLALGKISIQNYDQEMSINSHWHLSRSTNCTE